MKFVAILCLLISFGCAQHRGPASVGGNKVAHDTMAMGNIKASAVKSVANKDVCFDITLVAKGVEQRIAHPSNWTLAWVDSESKFHLLNMNLRDPASTPQGGNKIAPYGAYKEWSNNFRTCAPKARLGDVKSLVLTPKELPYKETEGMTLEWN